MKYFMKVISLVLIMVLGFGMVVSAAAAGTEGNKLVLVPLRLICEAQGAKVEWNGKTSTAVVTKGSKILSARIGSSVVKVNGKSIVLSSGLNAVNGRLKVPISLINEVLDTKMTVDDCLKIIAVKYVDLLRQGAVQDCLMLYSGYLSRNIKPDIVKQMGVSLNAFGNLKQSDIIVTKNSVHINVAVRYASLIAGQFDYIVRFDESGLIDDVMITQAAPDIAYKAPEYDKKDNYIEKEVAIGEGEWKLPGTLTIPMGKGPFPVVVLVHGSGANDRDETIGPLKPFRDLAVGLAARNIAVLRYEKRTLEHNLKFAFIEKATVKDETMDDAVAAVNFLSSIPEIDASRIIVLGHSQGGLLIPRILTGDKDGRIRGAVIMSGNTGFIGDLMCEQYKYLIGLNMATQQQYEFVKNQIDMIKSPDFSPDNPPQGFVMGTPYWWADLKAYNPVQTVKEVTKPLLVLQGERDYQVTAAQDFKGWKDALGSRTDVTFKLYSKLNHMYTEGEGKMSTPMEYYNAANIPAYVIDDIALWVESITK